MIFSLLTPAASSAAPRQDSHQKTCHFSRTPSGLAAIRRPGVNLAVWSRQPDPRCNTLLAALLACNRPLALDLQNPGPDTLAAALIRHIAPLRLAAACHILAEDIAGLTSLFKELAGSDGARVRFERVEDGACLLFHADTLRLRLICTYAGPGTQWVPNACARYDQLGLRGRPVEEANAAIVPDPAQIRQLAPWEVAVFSGRLREDTPPLIHRSAPVRCPSDYRIRLTVDYPDACC